MNEVQQTRVVPIRTDDVLRQIIKKAKDAIKQRRNADPQRVIQF